MKKIRKMILIVLTIFSTCLLIACDYEYYLYHEHIRQNTEVVQIDLINYNNPINTENPSVNTAIDIEKLVILETLSVDDNESFLIELSEIGGLSSKLEQTISSPSGSGILLSYQDGGFTLITVTKINDSDCIFVGHYDENANIEGFYGISWPDMIGDFRDLILKYFNTEIA